MKIRFWIMVFFVVVGMIFLVPSSAAEVATVGVSVEGVAWSEETVEVYLALDGLPPTGVSGVFLCLDIEGGTVESAEVTGAWGEMNTVCEWCLSGVTVMLDADQNVMSEQPFLALRVRADGKTVAICVRAATGGGVYAYDGGGVRRLPFSDGEITRISPDSVMETEGTVETGEAESIPDETVPIPPAGSRYVGHQMGIDDTGAVRFLILEREGERSGAVWCLGGTGRLSLSVTRGEMVSVYGNGKTDFLPARFPDGTSGTWCVYTFRGLLPDTVYDFCVEDESGIHNIKIRTPRFTS